MERRTLWNVEHYRTSNTVERRTLWIVLRRRHQELSRAVSKVDGLMMLSNVGGFVCHVVNIIILFISHPMLRSCYSRPNAFIIVLLYSIIFYRESTATPISAFIYLFVLSANMIGLLFAASAGIIVNHMVHILIVNVLF